MKRIILLADDSPTIQRLVTQTFTGGNFEVVSVSNGDAALRKLDEVRPDLVLADIYMPGKNGYEVCALVKKHEELGDTPVVLLAGAFDAFDEETASEVGAAAHITKPFEPQALVNLVTSLLSKEARARVATSRPAPESVQPDYDAVSVTPAEIHDISPAPVPTVQTAASSPSPAPLAKAVATDESGDLLGLHELFKPAPPPVVTVSDAEIERIADRVIKKLSTQVIESVAWDVVPEITVKVLREELKRQS